MYNTDEKIKELINVELSSRKNIELLKEAGIKIRKQRLLELIREKKGELANNVPDAPEAIEEETITTPEIKEEVKVENPFNMTDFSTAFGSFNTQEAIKTPEITDNKAELKKMADGINELISSIKNDPEVRNEVDPEIDFLPVESKVKNEEVSREVFTNDPIIKGMCNSRKEMKAAQEKAAEESDLKIGETPTFNLSFPSYFS